MAQQLEMPNAAPPLFVPAHAQEREPNHGEVLPAANKAPALPQEQPNLGGMFGLPRFHPSMRAAEPTFMPARAVVHSTRAIESTPPAALPHGQAGDRAVGPAAYGDVEKDAAYAESIERIIESLPAKLPPSALAEKPSTEVLMEMLRPVIYEHVEKEVVRVIEQRAAEAKTTTKASVSVDVHSEMFARGLLERLRALVAEERFRKGFLR
jgi:hypothetical protein